MVSILGEQYPTVPLTSIPKGSVVEIAWEIKIGERHQVEVKLGKDSPEVEYFQQLAEVRQMALNVHVR